MDMNSEIVIDGAHGEGGGQILRSSLALSLVTQRPIRIVNIRAGRSRPGLARQHLTAVTAATDISRAQVTGAAIGSRELIFSPGPVSCGEYTFRVGTAGSTTLVLQTVLPALLLASGPSTLILEGGTHNPWAPPFDFLAAAYLPLINRMGPQVAVELERPGFYPAGGGRFRVQITPATHLAGFDLLERGDITSRQARVMIARLPLHIAQRELDTIRRRLDWSTEECTVEEVSSLGPGNVILIRLDSAQITELFCSFGREGVKAEIVAQEAVKEVRDYLKANVPVGPYLADQLLLPLGISAWKSPPAEPNVPQRAAGFQRGGTFRTESLTGHSTTHAELLRQFLGISVEIAPETAHTCRVQIGPGAAGD
jgi:RNA 3'-terminal phosphate cyclase (ATP)